jgi:hypothetical protein
MSALRIVGVECGVLFAPAGTLFGSDVLNHHGVTLAVHMRIAAISIASLLLAMPAAAQTTSPGKSGTAPGRTGKSPGQKQQKDDEKTGKDYAPGRNQKKPGDAKDINSGSTQRKIALGLDD